MVVVNIFILLVWLALTILTGMTWGWLTGLIVGCVLFVIATMIIVTIDP